MEIKLYPNFDEVFTDETLKGVFYPLCSLRLENYPNKVFHFVSSNGLWIDEKFETENNAFSYTVFDIVQEKYKFNGDIKLYKGAEKAKGMFDQLQNDFKHNGKMYLETKLQTGSYIENIKLNLSIRADEEFDVDYYLQTFYEFSINKLIYELNNEFGLFRYKMEKHWSKPGAPSPIVYGAKIDELKEVLNNFGKPKIENIGMFEAIGKIIGCEFFTDGNDTVLFYNSPNKVLCLNSYS